MVDSVLVTTVYESGTSMDASSRMGYRRWESLTKFHLRVLVPCFVRSNKPSNIMCNSKQQRGSVTASLLMMILALAAVAVVQSVQVDGSGVPNSAQSVLRQKRGFRNSALSTARGFGKRVSAGSSLSPAAAELLGELPEFGNFDNSNRAIPTAWLAEQVTRSPALAKLIVEKAVDVNGDGMISQEELYQAL